MNHIKYRFQVQNTCRTNTESETKCQITDSFDKQSERYVSLLSKTFECAC